MKRTILICLCSMLLLMGCGNSEKQNVEPTTAEETTSLEAESEDSRNIISKKEYSIGIGSEVTLCVSLDSDKNFYFDVSIKSNSLQKATAIYSCMLSLKAAFNNELNSKSNITVVAENKTLLQYDDTGAFVIDNNTGQHIDISDFFDFSLSSKQKDRIEKEWSKIQDDFIGVIK